MKRNNKIADEQSEVSVDLLVIQQLVDKIDKAKILKEIAFSTDGCELKKKYYKSFNELPKKETTNVCEMFNGIQIVEDKTLPKNWMVWRFNNQIDNRIFFMKQGKLYELPKTKLGEINEPVVV